MLSARTCGQGRAPQRRRSRSRSRRRPREARTCENMREHATETSELAERRHGRSHGNLDRRTSVQPSSRLALVTRAGVPPSRIRSPAGLWAATACLRRLPAATRLWLLWPSAGLWSPRIRATPRLRASSWVWASAVWLWSPRLRPARSLPTTSLRPTTPGSRLRPTRGLPG